MKKAVDLAVDLYERAEFGEMRDAALDDVAGMEAFGARGPVVFGELLVAETDAAVFEREDGDFEGIAGLEDFGRFSIVPAEI